MNRDEIRKRLESVPFVVICVYWHQRNPLVVSVKRNCSICERTVAIDTDNIGRVEEAKGLLLCLSCYVFADINPENLEGAMMGGELLSFDEAKQAYKASKNSKEDA